MQKNPPTVTNLTEKLLHSYCIRSQEGVRGLPVLRWSQESPDARAMELRGKDHTMKESDFWQKGPTYAHFHALEYPSSRMRRTASASGL